GEKLGPKLLPLLQQGEAGIKAFIEQAKESGTALSDIDAGKLTAAQRGLDEIGEKFEGVKNQLAIALAPAIIAIGEKILAVLPSASRMGEIFTTVFQNIVIFAAAAADQIGHIVSPQLKVAAAASDLLNILTLDQTDIFDNASKHLRKLADDMGNSDLSSKAVKFLDEAAQKADKAGKKLADNLNKPIAAIGPQINENAKKIEEVLKKLQEDAAVSNGKPKEIFDLENMKASTSQIAQAKKLLDEISQKKIKVEVDKSLADLAKQIGTFGQSEGQKKLFDLTAMGA